jgi:hypothetical protein
LILFKLSEMHWGLNDIHVIKFIDIRGGLNPQGQYLL